MLYTIDSTIVNVALPNIQGTLQATQDQVAWVITSYIVVSAIATPLAGWLGTRYGLRLILAAAIAGFTAGSMLCGLATDLTEMVLFRMIQGAFGAALVPLSQVVLLQEFPRSRHGRVMALWGTGVMVGPIIGPTLGGWLTDELSWRWAFYINLPLGVIAWLSLMAAMPKGKVDARRPFDGLGFLLLSLALGLFSLMLDRGETKDWFASAEIQAEAFIAAIAMYMFAVHSLTSRHPFVDIHLFKDRNFTISLIIMFVIGLTVISPAVIVPGFLEQIKGYTPSQAGLLMAARGAASIVAMLAAPRITTLLGARRTMSIGICAAAASLWMMGQFSVDTSAGRFLAVSLIQGLGTPLTFMPLTLVAYTTLPDRARTEAGVLLTLLRNIGASVGVSIVVSLLARSAQMNQSYLGERFTAYATGRWQAVGALPGDNVQTATLMGEIGRQAAAIAYANDFYVLAACTIVTLPMVLALRASHAAPLTTVAALEAEH